MHPTPRNQPHNQPPNTAKLNPPVTTTHHNHLTTTPQPVGQKRIHNGSNKYLPGAGPAVPDMRCPETGSGYIMGGPIWAGPIHDFDFAGGEQGTKGVARDRERGRGREREEIGSCSVGLWACAAMRWSPCPLL